MHRKTIPRSPEVEHKLFHVPFGFTEFFICAALVEWVGGSVGGWMVAVVAVVEVVRVCACVCVYVCKCV